VTALRVGLMLYGYCDGYFGDSYGNKRVEAFGVDWIVAREEGGTAVFANIVGEWDMDTLISGWANPLGAESS
jgi:hypothetical protein